MNRLDTLLLFVVVGCALSIVNATYQQRRVFGQLEREQTTQRHLAQDWSRLQYEQSALSKTSRTEGTAHSLLKMDTVTPGRTQYLTVASGAALTEAPPASAANSGGAAAPGASTDAASGGITGTTSITNTTGATGTTRTTGLTGTTGTTRSKP